MTQAVILKKVAIFLKQCSPTGRMPWEEGGCCHGFAICHAAMDLIGKLDWWEEALIAIATWNETADELHQIIYSLNGTSAYSLETIFKRVINYIFTHQVGSTNEFDRTKETISKKFHRDQKAALIYEIIDILGNTLAIEIASFEKKFITFPDDMKLTIKTATSRLQDFGVHIMARSASNDLSQVLFYAQQSREAADRVALALKTQTHDGWSGLHFLARYAPLCLPQALSLAHRSSEGSNSIALALKIQNKNFSTGLNMLAHHASTQLTSTLSMAAFAADGIENILEALAQENQNSLTGRHVLKMKLPEYNDYLLNLFANHVKQLSTSDLYRLLEKIAISPDKADPLYRGLYKTKSFGFFGANAKYKETTLSKEIKV